MGHMNEVKQITDGKQRYAAGVMKYAQMGYWDGDYEPKVTDLLALWMSADRTVVGVGNIIGPAQRWLEHLGAEAELVEPAAVRAETSDALEEVPA